MVGRPGTFIYSLRRVPGPRRISWHARGFSFFRWFASEHWTKQLGACWSTPTGPGSTPVSRTVGRRTWHWTGGVSKEGRKSSDSTTHKLQRVEVVSSRPVVLVGLEADQVGDRTCGWRVVGQNWLSMAEKASGEMRMARLAGVSMESRSQGIGFCLVVAVVFVGGVDWRGYRRGWGSGAGGSGMVEMRIPDRECN